jgi:hypothetical protein
MELREKLSQQRVKHIIHSYQLAGHETSQVDGYVEEWFQTYPTPLIELAVVETLVDLWLTVPLVRGVAFMSLAHSKLKDWENQPITSTITPDQFQQITGLDPSPIFGSAEFPPPRPIMHPS